MSTAAKREIWMRGPVEGIISMLQPVAHALLQAREEVNELMQDFNDQHLWQQPAGKASVGFHLQHMRGVVQRLFTYARGEALTEEQLQQLKQEGVPDNHLNVKHLLTEFNAQVDAALLQLQQTLSSDLLLPRGIGRAQIPTNVLGLYFHAAEHTMRHLGQLLVTAAVVNK